MRATRPGGFVFQLAIFFIVSLIANIYCLHAATAATYFVRQEAGPGGSGLSWPEAFNQIQEAIDAAVSGDQIWIKTGSYSLVDTIHVTQAISLIGGFSGTETTIAQRDTAANPTTLNGLADRQTMVLEHPSGIIIDGITFSGSTYSQSTLEIAPSSNPLITGCRFINNIKGLGMVYGTVRDSYFSGNQHSIEVFWDGLTERGITALIEDCTFVNNLNSGAETSGWGAGVYLGSSSGAEIDHCLFTGNSAGAGSAVTAFTQATAVISDCFFGGETIAEGNLATTLGGGAIFGSDSSNLEISNSSFLHNRTNPDLDGGAIYSLDGDLSITGGTFIANSSQKNGGAVAIRRNTGARNSSITGSTFRNNTAQTQGGAVFSESDLTTISDSVFTNNSAVDGGGFSGSGKVENTLFNGNTATTGHGGGAFMAREEIQSDIVHCVFYENEAGTYGGAVSSEYSFTAANVVFFNNNAGNGYIDIYNINGLIPIISNSRIEQIPYAEGNNNIIDPPQFVDTASYNFHLMKTSPCIDAGMAAPRPGLPPQDPDGKHRPMDGNNNGVALPDIGIYELLPPGDIDLNGSLELADLIKTLQIVTGRSDLPITPVTEINGDNRVGLEEAVYCLKVLVETTDHSIPIVGPDVAGSNWVGTLDLENYGYQGHQSVTAVIKQIGASITITTSTTLPYGKTFQGTITSKGYISVMDKQTGQTWTTYLGRASDNAIQLYDYVNNFAGFDTLFLAR